MSLSLQCTVTCNVTGLNFSTSVIVSTHLRMCDYTHLRMCDYTHLRMCDYTHLRMRVRA